MTVFAALFLLAATRVDLVDGVVEIPRGDWQYEDLHVTQKPVQVMLDYEVLRGEPLRVLLMRRDDFRQFRSGRAHGILATSVPGRAGKLRYSVHEAGDYTVVVDNRRNEKQAAQVRLLLALDFSGRAGPTVGYISPKRQLAVIAISFAVFFTVVTWSARRILRAIGR